MIRRNTILYLLCAWMMISTVAGQSIHKAAHDLLINAPKLRSAHIGISIYDPGQDEYLFRHQADHFFLPASNTKIPTCYLAMKYLGDSLLSFRVRESGDSLFISPAGDQIGRAHV